MDLSPFVPLASALIGAAATVGLWALKTWSDGKAEQSRIAREDAREERQAQKEMRAQTEERASAIAGLFLDELQQVRQFDPAYDSEPFPEWFGDRWKTADIPLRRAIATVVDPEERNQLVEILDWIDDFETLSDWRYFGSGDEKRFVEEAITLGFELSSTMARGQTMDAELDARHATFESFATSYYAYQEEQQAAAREVRLAKLRQSEDE